MPSEMPQLPSAATQLLDQKGMASSGVPSKQENRHRRYQTPLRREKGQGIFFDDRHALSVALIYVELRAPWIPTR